MAAPTNHYKLGLFVLLSVVAAIATMVLLGAISLASDTVTYHTFFDESVQGLERGAPVKFRGVTIGHVSAIGIAPDHRHVDVMSALDVDDIERMALTVSPSKRGGARLALPPDLRAQLATQGITGVKFVLLEYFDPKSYPPPELPFPPPEHYIPAAPSMLKNLEEVVVTAMDRLPEVTNAVVVVMGRVDRLLATLERKDVAAEAAATLRHVDQVLSALHATVARLDRARLGDKASQTLDELHAGAVKMNSVLDQLGSDEGLIAGATRAIGEIGRRGPATQRELERTLRDLSSAADAIHSLAATLERDPEMLLKGKARGEAFK